MEQLKNGKEKQRAYANEYRRFTLAMEEEFYLEAISIGYAIIEDRLVSFLHHAGVISRDNADLRINRSVYPYMRRLLGKDDEYSIKIKDISVKINLICKLIAMTESEAQNIDEAVADFKKQGKHRKHIAKVGYMTDIYTQISANIEEELAFDILYSAYSWRKTRNQLIHALMNKPVDVSAIAKKQCAEGAYVLSRDLDNCLVKQFKVKNQIRKKYNIQ